MNNFRILPRYHYDVFYISPEFPLERHLGRFKGLKSGRILRSVIIKYIDTPSRYTFRVLEVETENQVYYRYYGGELRRINSIHF